MMNGGRVVITGATGQIGRPLTAQLAADGFDVVVLSRRPDRARDLVPEASAWLAWDAEQGSGDWVEALDGAIAVVGLAGAPFFRRWKSRAEFERVATGGRISANRHLVAAMRRAADPPEVFVTGSAVGYYGFTGGDEIVTEQTPAGADWWARGALASESEARAATDLGVRVVAIRTGIVLSPRQGMAAANRRQFSRGFGAVIGPGTQWLPWIHIADEVGLIRLAVTDQRITEALNASAPHPARYRHYAQALGDTLARPVRLRLPGAVMRWALGDVADSVLHNRRMIPQLALDLGYRFLFPDLSQALTSLLAD